MLEKGLILQIMSYLTGNNNESKKAKGTQNVS